MYNSKLYTLIMPPSSLPRHPREEAELGTNSLIVIVHSDRLELQHKASYYRGHGYSNRLIFPAGVHWCDTTRSDLQGGVHLVREHPTEAIRHNAVDPTAHQRGPCRSIALRAKGSWAYHPSLSGSLRGRWIPRNSIMDADPTVPQC